MKYLPLIVFGGIASIVYIKGVMLSPEPEELTDYAFALGYFTGPFVYGGIGAAITYFIQRKLSHKKSRGAVA